MFHLIVIIAGLIAGMLMFAHLPRLTPDKKIQTTISVVIPARNEIHNISAIIHDLKSQTLAPHEVICVDDGSEDGTAAKAIAAGARVIMAGPHPDGWVGKTWASQAGARIASGELLMFLDADVRLQPQALESIAALQQNRGGVVSVQPYHTVNRFYEHFSMFFNLISLAATGLGMPFLTKPTGMFGPVMLLPRNLYMEQGGHERVKSRVLEDFFLGKLYSKQNIPVTLRTGRGVVNYCMYPDGFTSLWQGWTKNFFSGAVSVSALMLLLSILWLTALSAAAVSVVRDAAMLSGNIWRSLGLYALCAAETAFAARQLGNFRWSAIVFYPIFLMGFHVIFLASVFKRLILRRVTWKGRTIDL